MSNGTFSRQAMQDAKIPLLIGTDQEGGQVQVLQGSGFGTIPSGLKQGTLPTATLRADAKTWGLALHRAYALHAWGTARPDAHRSVFLPPDNGLVLYSPLVQADKNVYQLDYSTDGARWIAYGEVPAVTTPKVRA